MKMTNRFGSANPSGSSRNVKPKLSKSTHQKLMSILVLEKEDSSSSHGVFIANSKVRDIISRIDNLFEIER